MKTRLSPILPVSLACGAFVIHFASGCTTERVVVVHDNNSDSGTILEGTGGSSGAGGRGAGGVGGATSPSPMGKKCLQDSECKAGLICLTVDGEALDPGGPANGMCTVQCALSDSGSADAECTAIDPNSVCVRFGGQGGPSYCLQQCTEGVSSQNKCQGRLDMVCSPLVDLNGNPTVAACQPMCGGDFDCKGRKCDFRTGACVDSTSGTLPIGSACDSTATTDPCNGFCGNPYGDTDAAAARFGTCYAPCSANTQGVGCGVDPSAQAPFDVQCLTTSTTAPGDQGLCFQLCDCNGDCKNPAFICHAWADTQSVAGTGRKGYCRGPVDDKGVAVSDIKCTTTTPPKQDAGAGGSGSGGAGPRDAAKD